MTGAPAPVRAQPGQVVVNGRLLTDADLASAEATFGAKPAPGDYWYDARAGLYGYVNHGTGGVARPNFPAAPMARNVSNGDTNILINGREITRGERDYLVKLFGGDPRNHAQYVGNYDLEANGDLKKNGVLLGNVAQRQAQQSTGNTSWTTKGGASGGASQGCSWVYVPNTTTSTSTTVMSGCD